MAAFFTDAAVQECVLKGDTPDDGSGTKGEKLADVEEDKDEKGVVLFSPMYQFFDNSGVH